MKRLQDSKKVLGQKKRVLVDRWNKKVLCNKPSAKQIRATKRAIQSMRRDRRDIVSDQDVYITETIKQEKEMREYKA
jgi:hypothetical protein